MAKKNEKRKSKTVAKKAGKTKNSRSIKDAGAGKTGPGKGDGKVRTETDRTANGKGRKGAKRKIQRLNPPAKSSRPAKRVARLKKQNITTQIKKRFTNAKGAVQLRDKKGHFISAENSEAILKVAAELDKRKIPYTYEELLDIPQIADRLLIFEDTTPRELFYWNALSLIAPDSKNKITGAKTKKYKIIGPDGSVLETGSGSKAAALVMEYNELLQAAELLAEDETDDNPYFTVEAKFTEDVNSEVLKMEIDFSKIGGRLPPETTNNYVDRAKKGEKPTKRKKVNTGTAEKTGAKSSSRSSAGTKGKKGTAGKKNKGKRK